VLLSLLASCSTLLLALLVFFYFPCQLFSIVSCSGCFFLLSLFVLYSSPLLLFSSCSRPLPAYSSSLLLFSSCPVRSLLTRQFVSASFFSLLVCNRWCFFPLSSCFILLARLACSLALASSCRLLVSVPRWLFFAC
jgi:hypothetical protein